MTSRSAWLLPRAGAGGQTREDTRLAPVGTMTPSGALITRSGVIPGGTPYAVSGTGMTITVGVGRGVVQGTTTQGPIPVVTTAAESILLPDGNGVNPRVDLFVAKVYENIYDSSGLTLTRIDRVPGTPAASPVAPAVPTASFPICEVLVPANASAGVPINWGTAVTNRKVFTSAVGGINPDGTTSGLYEGQYRDGGKTTGLERYDSTGAAWESRIYLGTAGRVVIGTDTALYRAGADHLKTDDSFTVGGTMNNLVSSAAEDVTSRTTTSTSLVTVAGLTPPTLVVPPSGKVRVTLITLQRNNGANNTFSSYRAVGSVSGTNYSETLTGSIGVSGTNNVTSTVTRRLTGLTAGETLTVTPYHMVNGGTGTYDYRYILLEGMGG